MNSPLAVLLLVLVSLALGCTRHPDLRPAPPPANHEQHLVGQLLLPEGTRNRGIEIQLLVQPSGEEPRVEWLLFDEKGPFDDQGHFDYPLTGAMLSLEVTSGVGGHVLRIDGEALPHVQASGFLDVGVIDARPLLRSHRMTLRAAEGSPTGKVRVGMWFGPPLPDVALGSRQFPPVPVGSELEWLLPLDEATIYFLVEHASGPNPETDWMGGPQQLFGPFSSRQLPGELVLD